MTFTIYGAKICMHSERNTIFSNGGNLMNINVVGGNLSKEEINVYVEQLKACLLYTSPSPRD